MLFTMTARRCKPTPISTLVFVCMLFFMSSTTLGFQTSTSIINSHGRNYNLNPILSSKKQLERSRTTLNSWNSDGDIEGPDRIKGCIPYMVCNAKICVTKNHNDSWTLGVLNYVSIQPQRNFIFRLWVCLYNMQNSHFLHPLLLFLPSFPF